MDIGHKISTPNHEKKIHDGMITITLGNLNWMMKYLYTSTLNNNI